jgi:uncharacterized protein
MDEKELFSIIQSLDYHDLNHDFLIEKEIIKIKKPCIYFLNPHPDFNFYVNDQKITEKTVVSNDDQIRWVSLDNKEEKFKLRLSKDAMELYLQIIDVFDFEFWPQITDIKDYVLLISPIKKIISSTPLSAVDVIEQIKDLGIEEANIDIDSINREIHKHTGQEILIAHGVQPEAGIDGHLDLFFQTENVTSFDEVNGKIDFKNKLKIPSVNPGDVLAYYHPKVDGKPGKNLVGKVVPPKAARDLKIQIDPSITQKQNVYFSTIFGRPIIRDGGNKQYLQVLNQYVHNGDVTIETGNLFFSGDVIVDGHVLDGMRVEASGDIHIMQNAYRCQLIAGGSIFVHGVIVSSQLYAGKDAIFFSIFHTKLSEIYKEFHEVYLMINQLMQKYSIVQESFSKTLSFLINAKHPELCKKTDELIKQISNFKMPIPEKMIELARSLAPFQHVYSIHQVDTIDKLEAPFNGLKELVEMEFSSKKLAEINFLTASYSHIQTSGNIKIIGDGTISCTLHAGNKVEYLSNSSTSRGDRIKAKKIYLSEVGTPLGDPVEIQVTEDLRAKNIFFANLTTPYWTKQIENSYQYNWNIKRGSTKASDKTYTNPFNSK